MLFRSLLLLLPALAIFATGNNTTTDLTNPTPIQEKNSPAEGRHVQIENSIQFGKHGRVIHSIAVMDEVHVQQKSQPTELYDNKRTTYAYDTLY